MGVSWDANVKSGTANKTSNGVYISNVGSTAGTYVTYVGVVGGAANSGSLILLPIVAV